MIPKNNRNYLAVIACRASSIVEMENAAVSCPPHRVAVSQCIASGEFRTGEAHRFYNTVSSTTKDPGK